jgi:hypothetical protein
LSSSGLFTRCAIRVATAFTGPGLTGLLRGHRQELLILDGICGSERVGKRR